MKKYIIYIFTILIAAIGISCSDQGKTIPAPLVTGQGFDINEPQQGTIGNFGDIRIRIEAPGKIDSLIISERSFEVDLATTPERSYFPLFGINKKIGLRKDITLNFKNYINEKINATGEYHFDIRVVDKAGKSTTSKISIVVKEKVKKQAIIEAPAILDQEPTPIKLAKFKFQRIGKGKVKGAEAFGITWITIDEINVGIKISKTRNGPSGLARLTGTEYDAIASREQLNKKINDAKRNEFIVLPTAKNAASGAVLAVTNYEKYYLLKVSNSTTSLSDAGTTVTLAGEYKF